MKRILLTGGAGYIGSKLATKLLEHNYKVTVIDCLKFKIDSLHHLFENKNFAFIKGDVRNKKLMRNLIKKNEFIIPLAALVGAPLCEKNIKEAILHLENASNQKVIGFRAPKFSIGMNNVNHYKTALFFEHSL